MVAYRASTSSTVVVSSPSRFRSRAPRNPGARLKYSIVVTGGTPRFLHRLDPTPRTISNASIAHNATYTSINRVRGTSQHAPASLSVGVAHHLENSNPGTLASFPANPARRRSREHDTRARDAETTSIHTCGRARGGPSAGSVDDRSVSRAVDVVAFASLDARRAATTASTSTEANASSSSSSSSSDMRATTRRRVKTKGIFARMGMNQSSLETPKGRAAGQSGHPAEKRMGGRNGGEATRAREGM